MRVWGKKGRILLLVCCALAFGTITLLLSRSALVEELLRVISDPESLRDWFARFGAYDEVAFVLLRAAQTCIKFIPAEPLEIGSGYLWGAGWGMLWCLAGNILGSFAILLLTRRFGRRLVERLLPEKATAWLETLQQSHHIYGVLAVIYLIPGTPKDSLVYLAGLMNVDLRIFMAINILGRIPSILSSTVCGAALGQQQYLLAAGIFALTIVMAFAGGALYRRWLAGKKLQTS